MSQTVSASTGVDVQLLLDLCAALLSLNQLVTKRSCRPVPESLTRILLHGADHVLGVFLGLIFVEQRDDLTHHRLYRVTFIANRLRHGDDPDAMFGELAKIKLLFERLAEKPAVTMDEDYPECLLPIAGTLDHLLEGRSAIVPGGSAVFDKLCGHGEALGTAPGFQLAALVGNRKVVLSLTAP